jgi:hypothetical protein
MNQQDFLQNTDANVSPPYDNRTLPPASTLSKKRPDGLIDERLTDLRSIIAQLTSQESRYEKDNNRYPGLY